jgi:hypothetical protein
MRTHDPNWQPDPKVKYTKTKRQRLDDTIDDAELAEGVRTISTLLTSGTSLPIVQAANPYSANVLAGQQEQGSTTTSGGISGQVIVDANTLAAAIAQAQRVNGSSGDGDYASEDADGEGVDGGEDEEIDELAGDDDDNTGRSSIAREAEIALLEYLRGIGPKTSGIRGEGREGQSDELADQRDNGGAHASRSNGVDGDIEHPATDGSMDRSAVQKTSLPSEEPLNSHPEPAHHTLSTTTPALPNTLGTSVSISPIAIDKGTTRDDSGDPPSDPPGTPSTGTALAEERMLSTPSTERPLKRKR